MSTTDLTAARLRRPGPDGARILLIAGRSWLDTAASPDDHRVPVRLLDRLWLSSRRGVQLDVVCGVNRVVKLLETFADAWNVAAYDAVVVLPDLARAPLSPRLQRVLDRISTLTVVLGVSDTAMRNRALGARPAGWHEIRISPGPGDCPAATVAEVVGAARLSALGRTPPATAELGPRHETVTDHLQRIAQLASSAFSVDSATIAVLAAGRARTLAAVGPVLADQAYVRAAAVRPMVVLDTWRDTRFTREVRPRGAVRFFAAHPLELDDGSAMGTLSVFDTEPRLADEFDADVLRDLAVLASAELAHSGRRSADDRA